MSFPGIPKEAGNYVPPPPTEGVKIPPPPVHAEVTTFEISVGPSPSTLSFPGIPRESGPGADQPANGLEPLKQPGSYKKPVVAEPTKEIILPDAKMKPLFWRRYIVDPNSKK